MASSQRSSRASLSPTSSSGVELGPDEGGASSSSESVGAGAASTAALGAPSTGRLAGGPTGMLGSGRTGAGSLGASAGGVLPTPGFVPGSGPNGDPPSPGALCQSPCRLAPP